MAKAKITAAKAKATKATITKAKPAKVPAVKVPVTKVPDEPDTTIPVPPPPVLTEMPPDEPVLRNGEPPELAHVLWKIEHGMVIDPEKVAPVIAWARGLSADTPATTPEEKK